MLMSLDLIQRHSDIFKCELSEKACFEDKLMSVFVLKGQGCCSVVMYIENRSHSFKNNLFSNYILSCYRPYMYLYIYSILINN